MVWTQAAFEEKLKEKKINEISGKSTVKYSWTVRNQVNAKGWKEFDSAVAVEEELQRLEKVEKLLKNEDGKMKYSAAVRKLFKENNGWNLSVDEVEPLLERLQNEQSMQQKLDIADKFQARRTSNIEQRQSYKQARSQFMGLVRETDANGDRIYSSDARKIFNRDNEGFFEKFFDNYNLEEDRQELNRLQDLVKARTELQSWLADEKYSKAAIRLFKQRNQIYGWKGNRNLEPFFATFDATEEELAQLNASLGTADTWIDEIKGKIYANLFKNGMMKNLLEAAGVYEEINAIKKVKARDMIDGVGEFQQTEADTKTSRIDDLITAVASYEDCVNTTDVESGLISKVVPSWHEGSTIRRILDGQMGDTNVDYCFEAMKNQIEDLAAALN